MSPEAETMLVEDIAPRVRIASRCLPQVGADDADELYADGMAMAAEMLTSAERRGKEVTAGNIAWYVRKQLSVGRRSGYGGRTDAICPAALLDDRTQLTSLEMDVGFDPDIVEMVLVNLLSNVEKYASEGKHVEVISKLADTELIVTVNDHGPGIPRRHHRRVFRAFSRLDDSIRAPSGTGIGLTIARRAALRHGGDLRLIACSDGSCFELRIPVE